MPSATWSDCDRPNERTEGGGDKNPVTLCHWKRVAAGDRAPCHPPACRRASCLTVARPLPTLAEGHCTGRGRTSLASWTRRCAATASIVRQPSATVPPAQMSVWRDREQLQIAQQPQTLRRLAAVMIKYEITERDDRSVATRGGNRVRNCLEHLACALWQRRPGRTRLQIIQVGHCRLRPSRNDPGRNLYHHRVRTGMKVC